MPAPELLLQMLHTRKVARAFYAHSLGVFANPTIATMLQQFLPITDRHALVLSSGRDDIAASNLTVQLDPQQLVPYQAGATQNILSDTFQGIGTLESHVGESNFDWANNNGGIDYDTQYGNPVEITADGLQIPGTVPTGQQVKLFCSLVDGTDIFTMTATNDVVMRIGWNLLTDQPFYVLETLSVDASGVGSYITIEAQQGGGVFQLTCSVSVAGVITVAQYAAGTAVAVGAHVGAATINAAGITLTLDGVEVASSAADLSALPALGYYRAASKNNSLVNHNIFVTELGVTPSSSTVPVTPYQFLRGIEVARLKPELILDFNVAPTNPVSVAAQEYTTPASPLLTVLDITQGF